MGWLAIADGSVWCLDCAPEPGDVRQRLGVEADDELIVVAPVDVEHARRTEACCRACGRDLADLG